MYLPLYAAILVTGPAPMTTIVLLSTTCTEAPFPAEDTGGSDAELRIRISVMRILNVPACRMTRSGNRMYPTPWGSAMSMEAIEPSASSSAKECIESKRRPTSMALRVFGSAGAVEFPGISVATATRLAESATASSGSVLVVRNRITMDPGNGWPTRALRGGWTTTSMAYRISSGDKEWRPDLECPEVRL
jgi:hypothetical protein